MAWDQIYHEYLSEDHSKEILNKIYRLLSFLVHHNKENQEALLSKLPSLFMNDFLVDKMNGCVAFMYHFILENDHLSDREEYVDMMIKKLFIEIETTSVQNPHSSYILNILANLVNTDKKRSKATQNLVLRKLFESNNLQEKDGLKFDQECFKALSEEIMSSPQVDITNDKVKGIIISARACYQISFMNLLCTCCEGKNSFSENISQNIIPLPVISSVLTISNLHTVIKLSIVSFIFEVYVDTERENYFNHQEMIINVVPHLLVDFKKILLGEYEYMNSKLYLVTTIYCTKYQDVVIKYQNRICEFFMELLRKNVKITQQYVPYYL